MGSLPSMPGNLGRLGKTFTRTMYAKSGRLSRGDMIGLGRVVQRVQSDVVAVHHSPTVYLTLLHFINVVIF